MDTSLEFNQVIVDTQEYSCVNEDSNIPASLLQTPLISVIIPTYNERENISTLVKRIASSLTNFEFEVIFIDDNSPDETYNAIVELNQVHRNVKVYKRTGKLGLSSAVLLGFKEAEGDILAVMDADLQHPPEILSKMVEAITGEHDLVVASRYVEGGKIENFGLRRQVYSKGASIIAHMLFPRSRRVKDVMSGCFMLRKTALNGVYLDPVGFKILLEVLAKCKFSNIVEIPYTFTNRKNGKSNLSSKEIRNFLIHVYRISVKNNISRLGKNRS